METVQRSNVLLDELDLVVVRTVGPDLATEGGTGADLEMKAPGWSISISVGVSVSATAPDPISVGVSVGGSLSYSWSWP